MSFNPVGIAERSFDPTIRIVDRTGVHTAAAPARKPVPRKVFTDRLGLPATATDAQVFAAIDAVNEKNAEEALYARVTGRTGSNEQPDEAANDLFAKTYPSSVRG